MMTLVIFEKAGPFLLYFYFVSNVSIIHIRILSIIIFHVLHNYIKRVSCFLQKLFPKKLILWIVTIFIFFYNVLRQYLCPIDTFDISKNRWVNVYLVFRSLHLTLLIRKTQLERGFQKLLKFSICLSKAWFLNKM